MAPKQTSDLEELERFVAENDDLWALEQLVGRFNIFDALGIARAEIRHSNFLAWLLDPAESHGQGDLFLKAVLLDLLRRCPREQRPFSPIELDGADIGPVSIRREWKYTDLLIDCAAPEVVVVIENKVDSGEHSDQLSKYEATLAEHCPGRRCLHVLLSPDGRAATREKWVPYSYVDLHRSLQRAAATAAGSIGADVRTFLDHYLSLIGTQFMEDPKLAELCARIVKNHRRALDLLWEYRRSPQQELIDAIAERLRADPRWIVTRTRTGRVDFAPADWPSLVPPICGQAKPNEPWEWLVVTVSTFEDTMLYLELYVGPTKDQALRDRLLDRIDQDPELGIRNKRKDKLRDNDWRVIYSKQVSKWSEQADPDAVLADLDARIDEFWPYLKGVTELLRRQPLTAG